VGCELTACSNDSGNQGGDEGEEVAEIGDEEYVRGSVLGFDGVGTEIDWF
jgi:hypothetical protein